MCVCVCVCVHFLLPRDTQREIIFLSARMSTRSSCLVIYLSTPDTGRRTIEVEDTVVNRHLPLEYSEKLLPMQCPIAIACRDGHLSSTEVLMVLIILV